MEHNILKNATAYFAKDPLCYAFIKAHQSQYPIILMSEILDVSASRYYAWCNRAPSPRMQRDAVLAVYVKAAHTAMRHNYGDQHLHAELKAMVSRFLLTEYAHCGKGLALQAK